jgi:hypothetical protein
MYKTSEEIGFEVLEKVAGRFGAALKAGKEAWKSYGAPKKVTARKGLLGFRSRAKRNAGKTTAEKAPAAEVSVGGTPKDKTNVETSEPKDKWGKAKTVGLLGAAGAGGYALANKGSEQQPPPY